MLNAILSIFFMLTLTKVEFNKYESQTLSIKRISVALGNQTEEQHSIKYDMCESSIFINNKARFNNVKFTDLRS